MTIDSYGPDLMAEYATNAAIIVVSAFARFQLGNGLLGGGIGHLHVERQALFVGDAQHQQTDGVGNRQPHCFKRAGGPLLGVGVNAGADVGVLLNTRLMI